MPITTVPIFKRPLKVAVKAVVLCSRRGHYWYEVSSGPSGELHLRKINGKLVRILETYVCKRCRTVMWNYEE
jgi:hypothetical protein